MRQYFYGTLVIHIILLSISLLFLAILFGCEVTPEDNNTGGGNNQPVEEPVI
jgi:hypothetical protein